MKPRDTIARERGRPDVYVKIFFKDQLGGEKTIYYADTGWWEGSWRNLNSQIINWGPAHMGYYIAYSWWEDDPDSNVSEKKVTLPLEGGGSFQLTFKVGTNDEEIGKSYVYYYDEVPKQYDPTGNSDFVFVTKLN